MFPLTAAAAAPSNKLVKVAIMQNFNIFFLKITYIVEGKYHSFSFNTVNIIVISTICC